MSYYRTDIHHASHDSKAWADWFITATNAVKGPVVRADITLKQFRASDLDTVRRLTPADVRVPPRQSRLSDAGNFSVYHRLSDEEIRRSVIRTMNKLNRAAFGNRARRTHNPLRLTALVCRHDKDTRSHLHALIALPPLMSVSFFEQALDVAVRSEPFVHTERRVELAYDVRASVIYNLDPQKACDGDPIVYVHVAQSSKRGVEHEERGRAA